MSFPEIGSSVAHFQILERLGRGGMGVVYKARDLRLGRLVALKFMTPDFRAIEGSRRRFLREAQAVSVLDHPNVCPLYEIGETDDGQTFFAMAYCRGEALRSRLSRGPLEPTEAVDIAAQVADGLAAAHAHGIVHRDIHPGNILVAAGLVKLVDFGVAQLAGQTPLTKEGIGVGTIAYAAPEQVCGEEVGPESDLWSLGIVLYEAITGRLPFQSKSIPSLLLSILNAPAPLQDVPSALRWVLARALAKHRKQRYPNAAAMQADLLAAAAELQDVETPSASRVSPGPPLLHNLPFSPLGELLKGRNEELQEVAEDMAMGGRALVLHGLGGVGKTRLALEHAWRHGFHYRAVLFVLADSPDGLNGSLAALARGDLLNLPERNSPAETEALGAVLRWLKENAGWLLILDNVDTREAQLAVNRLLPSLTGGSVLITSRLRDWPAGIRRRAVDRILVQQAVEFLLKRTEEDRKQEPDDAEQALRLAELLAGLPLALEQAAAYIVHTQSSLAEYLSEWEWEGGVPSWHDPAVTQYPASLAITWKRSFDQLAPGARAILRLSSLLAPDPIPVGMFEPGEVGQATELLLVETGLTVSIRGIRDDLAELRSLSLISAQGNLVSVHRLMQEVVRNQIPQDRRKAWTELALTMVSRYAPFNSAEAVHWPIWDVVRPHATEILAHAREQGALRSTVASDVLTRLGGYLYGKGLYAEAEPLFRSSLAIEKRISGRNHSSVAVRLANLAVLLRESGRPAKAEPLMRKALEITRTHGTPLHLSKQINGLALILMDRKEWAEAEELLREALARDEEDSVENGYALARDLHNLALLLASTGRASEAEPVIRRSLEISYGVHEESDPKIARRTQILAGILRDQGRATEAEPLLRHAVEGLEQSLGPNHPWTLSARKDLACLTAA
ncbi:MAG TPA: tetratricopeptide repeat protein [Thermoanaerobaculia bacterium]|nr:tetratricopeptide repeat protein [Thermoanaerobaculia bacterium]